MTTQSGDHYCISYSESVLTILAVKSDLIQSRHLIRQIHIAIVPDSINSFLSSRLHTSFQEPTDSKTFDPRFDPWRREIFHKVCALLSGKPSSSWNTDMLNHLVRHVVDLEALVIRFSGSPATTRVEATACRFQNGLLQSRILPFD